MMDDWAEFEREILDVAKTFVTLGKCEGDHRPPHEVVSELKIIDKALTNALQKLVPLRLEHAEGQDISTAPFNWPVVQSLGNARAVIGALRGDLVEEAATYPTELIKGLRELRDAARKAIELEKPGRGNSERRNPKSARRADLAKNFVSRHRSRFGHMPPVSHAGQTVDLMDRMLVAAGESGADAYELLRQAIDKGAAGGESLPNARTAKSAKRAK